MMETVTFIPYKGERAVLGNSMDITEQIRGTKQAGGVGGAWRHPSWRRFRMPSSVCRIAGSSLPMTGSRRSLAGRPRNSSAKAPAFFTGRMTIMNGIAQLIYRILEKQPIVRTEFPCRRKDGTDMECMISASRIGERLQEKRHCHHL